MASKRDVEAGRAYVRLFLKNDLAASLSKALSTASQELKTFSATVSDLGKTLSGVGITAGIPIALATKRFADFDDTMRAVAGVTQATSQQLQAMTDKAKALGAATSYTAVEVGQVMT